MLVHPVAVPGLGTRSWTVLGDDDVPVVPVDRFLAYLTGIGRSPNTVKAYSHDLKDYWEFLGFRSLDWREARLEDIGEFVAWLQLPPAGRSGEVAVLPSVTAEVSASTVNRKLAAVSAFYAHQARNGAGVGDLLAAWRTGGRGGWKPFLHHISKDKPYRGRAISLKVPKKLPRILTVAETQAILDACTRLRDRFFFALMHETGCRAGEVLGLRHEDIAAAECEITIAARENANGARAKSGGRTVPVAPELIRLYADYLHEEYGGIALLTELRGISAAQKAKWPQPRVATLTGMSCSAGHGGCDRGLNATESGHSALNGSPTSPRCRLFASATVGPQLREVGLICDDIQTLKSTLIVQRR